jgi:hypothetical protein
VKRTGLLVLALAAGCGGDDAGRPAALDALQQIIATCSEVGGEVEVKREGEGFWAAAQIGAVFRPGDWIRSGSGAYARVEFLGSGSLELDENAVVILDAQEIPAAEGGSGEPGQRAALVAVESGAVRGVMQAQDGGTSAPLLFQTADGARGRLDAARGAGSVEFRLTRRERATEVAVSSGEATVALSGEQRTITAGEAAEAEAGKLTELILIGPPGWGTPRSDTRHEFLAGRPIILRWEAVVGASSYRVQISRDPTFRTGVENRVVEGNEYPLIAPAAGSYGWRVASRDAEGRFSEFGLTRRLFLEAGAPEEHLLEPEPGAVFGHAGDAIRVAFRWRKGGGGTRQYRLVVARGPDLQHDRVVSQVARDERAEVGGLGPGKYYWGVYAQDEEELQPLFLQPRPLVIKRVSPSTLRTPKKVKRWGD